MEFIFKSRKLAMDCNNLARAQKRWGTKRGKVILLRLQQLSAATNLKIAVQLPQARCHQLSGNRKNQFSAAVIDPYRLIFEPANETMPLDEKGGIDLANVTKVKILEIVDYHE